MFRFRLKELREKRGYSQAALAAKLGVSQSTVGMWENGTNYPKVHQLIAISELFHSSIDYMLCRDKTDYLLSDSDKLETQDESEAELLSLYRSVNSDTKGMILAISRKFADSPPAKEGTTGR